MKVRALVMLACLVAVPLVAMFGGSLPDEAAALVRRWKAKISKEVREPLAEAPRFGTTQAQEDAGGGEASRSASRQYVACGGGKCVVGPDREVVSPQGGQEAAGYPDYRRREPSWGGSSEGSLVQAQMARGTETIPTGYRDNGDLGARGRGASGVLRADQEAIAEVPGRRGAGVEAAEWNHRSDGRDATALESDLRRLEQMGAVAWRLESWGDQGRGFRFQCRVALNGDPECVRHFESTNVQWSGAVSEVVRAVESWRGGLGSR